MLYHKKFSKYLEKSSKYLFKFRFKNKLFQSIRPKFSLLEVEQLRRRAVYINIVEIRTVKNRFQNNSLIFSHYWVGQLVLESLTTMTEQ